LRYYPGILLEETEENHEKPQVRIAGVQGGI
jgi:hypothetical protein